MYGDYYARIPGDKVSTTSERIKIQPTFRTMRLVRLNTKLTSRMDYYAFSASWDVPSNCNR